MQTLPLDDRPGYGMFGRRSLVKESENLKTLHHEGCILEQHTCQRMRIRASARASNSLIVGHHARTRISVSTTHGVRERAAHAKGIFNGESAAEARIGRTELLAR